MNNCNLAKSRCWGIAGLIVISLTSLGGLPLDAAPMPGWQQQGYPIHSLALQAQGGQPPVLQLQGARNETLLLFFELSGTPATNLEVKLTGQKGAPLPDWQVLQVRPIPTNLPRRYFWDGLVPLGSPLVYPEPPVRLMVKITLRPGHPAGSHHYDLIFRHGRRWCRQRLEMRVWDFTLPADLPISIMANLWPRQEWFKRYGVGSLDAWERLAPAYLSLLRQYKINAIAGFYPFPAAKVAQGQPLTDFPQYLRFLDMVVQLGFRHFRLPPLPGAPNLEQRGNAFQQQVGKFYPSFYRYLQSKGWVNKALVKVWDEPDPLAYPQVVKAYGLIKAAAPGLRTESAGKSPSPDLARVVDIWAVYNAHYEPDKVAAARRQGQEIWLYANMLHAPYQPPTYQRVIGWYLYQYGFSGYLLWSVNYWPLDPWTNPPSAGRRGGDFFRRGTFLYPDPQTGRPLPSLRLETLRRGWEDFQYLVLLQEAASKGLVDQAAYKRLQEKITSSVPDLREKNPRVTWPQLEDLRLQIGEMLDRAGGGRHG